MVRVGVQVLIVLASALLLAGCLRSQPDAPIVATERGLSLHLFDAERVRQSTPIRSPAGSATPGGTLMQAPVYSPATPTPLAFARTAASAAPAGAVTIPYAPVATPTTPARFPGFDVAQLFQPLAAPTPSPAFTIGQAEMLALPRPGDPPPAPPIIVPPPAPGVPAAVVAAPPRSVAAPAPIAAEIAPAVQSVAAPVVIAATAAPTETPPPTPTSAPTAPPLPTITPTLPPTTTPAPSATATICAGDERLSFEPASPVAGSGFTAAARSIRAHLYVSLEGPGNPQFTGAAREGQTNVWRWQVTAASAGSVGYNFVVDGRICATASVQVQAPVPTASPTPSLLPDSGRSGVTASASQVAPGVAVYLYVSVRNAAGQPLPDRLVGVSGGRAADQIGQPSRTGSDGVASIGVTVGSAGASSFAATDLSTGITLGQVTITALAPATNTPAAPTATPMPAGPTATATLGPGAPTSTARPAPTSTPRSPAIPGSGN